jgi:hypothetical protein
LILKMQKYSLAKTQKSKIDFAENFADDGNDMLKCVK